MSRKASDGIMAGLNDALAYTKGDKSRAARVVRIKPRDMKAEQRKTRLSRPSRSPVAGPFARADKARP